MTRAAEELAALAGRPVRELTAEVDVVPDADVVLGTEAVLHRVRSADAVVFLDIDQELLAPRYRAGEESLALLARAYLDSWVAAAREAPSSSRRGSRRTRP